MRIGQAFVVSLAVAATAWSGYAAPSAEQGEKSLLEAIQKLGQGRKEEAIGQLKRIAEDFENSDAKTSDGRSSVYASALASLLHLYGDSPEGLALVKKFAGQLPNLSFQSQNGVGETRPEAYAILARNAAGKDKRSYLQKIIFEFDDSRVGRNRSEEYEYYADKAIGELLASASSKEEWLKRAQDLVEQSESPRARAVALRYLGDRALSEGDKDRAVSIFERLAGSDGQHEMVWNETYSMYAQYKLDELHGRLPKPVIAPPEPPNRVPPIYRRDSGSLELESEWRTFALYLGGGILTIGVFLFLRLRTTRSR